MEYHPYKKQVGHGATVGANCELKDGCAGRHTRGMALILYIMIRTDAVTEIQAHTMIWGAAPVGGTYSASGRGLRV